MHFQHNNFTHSLRYTCCKYVTIQFKMSLSEHTLQLENLDSTHICFQRRYILEGSFTYEKCPIYNFFFRSNKNTIGLMTKTAHYEKLIYTNTQSLHTKGPFINCLFNGHVKVCISRYLLCIHIPTFSNYPFINFHTFSVCMPNMLYSVYVNKSTL